MTILEALEKAKKLREARGDARGAGAAAPSVREHAVTRVRRKSREGTQAQAVRLEFPLVPLDERTCEESRVLLGTSRHRYSSVLDSYRILRARLLPRLEAADNLCSIGFVSAGPGEGKTVTCINLALAFAREKKRNVFLLDLDLRNPSVCRYLGVQPPAEIGGVLSGEVPAHEAFFSVGVENLVVAGGNTSYENSSELLGGPGMEALVDAVHERDPRAIILVDLPPLLLAADALAAAPFLSSVVLVVAEGQTRRDQLEDALEVLSGTHVAGIVLNRSREHVEDYYS